jgi:L-aspartate oxidase
MARDCIQTDVLVIGSGIAGGVAALQLAEAGIPLVIATQASSPEESSTYYAQGGIVYRGIDDSSEQLIDDILRAGAGHCDRRSVQILAHEGPQLVDEILVKGLGVHFERSPEDEFSLANEGGHSVHRILHVADSTGQAIETQLIKKLCSVPGVTMLTGYTAIDLLTPAHHSINRIAVYDPPSCVGAYFLEQATGRVIRVLAKKTVLATGGLGQIYLRTTNPSGARGDGLAMAYRAGARVINCEYIQFHPTAFYKQNAPCFLITEAIRGAGARLVNHNSEPFMDRYDPQWKDLAPRDIVARGIHEEMLRQDTENVYLDAASSIPAKKIKSQFPSIFNQCQKYGIDITRDPIPVVPAAHYSCGGVWVDEWGRSTIEHLYGVGEVSCTGVHGANRLASTSLLEGLVWGKRSATHIVGSLRSTELVPENTIPPWLETGTEAPDAALISQDLSVIKHIMWNYAGLIRSDRRLQRALRELRNLEAEIEQFYRAVRPTDELIGLRNAIRAAFIVTLAAWENKSSRGCHYRR